jgi:hypothetical protein
MSRCIEPTPCDELHGTVSGDLLKSRVQCPGADARELAESFKREGFREVMVFEVSTHLSHVSPMVARRQRSSVKGGLPGLAGLPAALGLFRQLRLGVGTDRAVRHHAPG